MSDCKIKYVGKQRNGANRYWCLTHGSEAVSTIETTPNTCQSSFKTKVKDSEILKIDPQLFEGGVGIWGALAPVFDNTIGVEKEIYDGVHVHARTDDSTVKCIDDTFKEVYIKSPQQDLFGEFEYIKIDNHTATAYTTSMITEANLVVLNCNHCLAPHIDSGIYAAIPHKKHLCHSCGKMFMDIEKSISNPAINLRRQYYNLIQTRTIREVDRSLNISIDKFPGGIQIWGSNPAILWTSNRDEEAGIHVHAYNEKGVREIDETFGTLTINGKELNSEQIRMYMVQKSIPDLEKSIVSIICPQCNEPHFDIRTNAVMVHRNHVCNKCEHNFMSTSKVVSNPVSEILNSLNQSA